MNVSAAATAFVPVAPSLDTVNPPTASAGTVSARPSADSVNAFLAALQAFLNTGTVAPSVVPAPVTTAAADGGDIPGAASSDADASDATAKSTAAADDQARAATDVASTSLVVPAVVLAAHSAMAAAALLALPGGTATGAKTPVASPLTRVGSMPSSLPQADGSEAADSATSSSGGAISLDAGAWQAVVSQLLDAVNRAAAQLSGAKTEQPGDSNAVPVASTPSTDASFAVSTPSVPPALATLAAVASNPAIASATFSFAMSAAVKSVDVSISDDAPVVSAEPVAITAPRAAALPAPVSGAPTMTAGAVAAQANGGDADDASQHEATSQRERNDAKDATAATAAADSASALATAVGTASAPPVASHTVAAPAAPQVVAPPAVPDPAPVPTAHVTMSLDQGITGASRIRIAVQGTAVRATIITNEAGAGRMDRELPTLRRALEDQGFSDVRVAVRVDDPSSVTTPTATSVAQQLIVPSAQTSANSSGRPSGEQPQQQQRQSPEHASQEQKQDRQHQPRQGRRQQQEEDEG